MSERHEKSFIFFLPLLLTKSKNNCNFKLFDNYQFRVITMQVPIRGERNENLDIVSDARL